MSYHLVEVANQRLHKVLAILESLNARLERVEEEIVLINQRLDTRKIKPIYTSSFEEFWKAYPKRRDKKEALHAYNLIMDRIVMENPGVNPHQLLMERTKLFADYHKRKDTEMRFIQHPHRWLRNDGWMLMAEDYEGYRPTPTKEGRIMDWETWRGLVVRKFRLDGAEIPSDAALRELYSRYESSQKQVSSLTDGNV